MKKFISEFKEFALKGNMIDLAIGMIIATAFNAVVKSIVDDLIMPAFAFIFGKSDFSQLVAFAQYDESGALIGGIKYGMFIQNIVNFLIISICLFVAVKVMNKLKNPKPVEEEKEEEPAPKPDDIVLLEEIRDLLAKEKANQ